VTIALLIVCALACSYYLGAVITFAWMEQHVAGFMEWYEAREMRAGDRAVCHVVTWCVWPWLLWRAIVDRRSR
jgi:hypothetical protein